MMLNENDRARQGTRFPQSPRLRSLKRILAKLGVGTPHGPEPYPGAEAAGRAQHGAGKETASVSQRQLR
jgi:hypothetical protein